MDEETTTEENVEESMDIHNEEEVETEEVETSDTPSEKDTETEGNEEELFELPDGRKVDAETLSKEWKENFSPEFTKKSQELAELKKQDITNNKTEENPFADPSYIPKSYEEIISVAEERALAKIEAKEQEKIEQREAVENEVSEQLATIKKSDPTLNENALFLHANKYGFRDLSQAYQNMKDMSKVAKDVQAETVKNINKRADPVSTTGTNRSTGTQSDPSQFETARDYLKSLK